MSRDYADMSSSLTIGEQLRALQKRSGLSYDAIAKKAGYNGRSSIQRYFSPEYDPDYLPLSVAEKLADGFDGSDVARSDVMSLAGMPEGNGKAFRLEGGADVRLQRNLPVYGTALGAPRDFDGEAIEQTMLNSGEVISYLPRPTILDGVRHAYGLYVQGQSMSPRFDNGDTIIVTDSRVSRPARIGDDVVVYMRDDSVDDGETACAVLVKRLVRRTGRYVELEQFNPAVTFKLDALKILRLDRVVPWSEILS